MENHRLLPMIEDYDVGLFNSLYSQTEGLRVNLVNQINPRRFGVTKDIIKSWFDDKFIFVFNKYYGKVSDEVLKGYIISSLKTFKYRVLRNAYTKGSFLNDNIHIEDYEGLINIIPLKEDNEDHEILYKMAMSFMKKNLTPDAFTILDIEINPPLYITSKLKSLKTKIPAKLIAEYLDIDKENISYINTLRKEINKTIKKAELYFNN